MLQDQAIRRGHEADREREDLFNTLEELYRRSQRMLAARQFTFEDARKLSVSITSVRTLLSELAEIESRMPFGPQSAAAIRNLKDRYWELEGRVKEARNSLERDGHEPV